MSTAVNLYEVRFAALPASLTGNAPHVRYGGLWDSPDRTLGRYLGYTRIHLTQTLYARNEAPIIPAGGLQMDIGDQELAPFVAHLALEGVLDRIGQIYVGLHEDFPGSIGQHEWPENLGPRQPLIGIGAKAWTLAPTQFPLGPPTLVRGVPGAAPNNRTSIVITWQAPVDLGGEAIRGYNIKTANVAAGPYTDLVADTGNTNLTHTQTGVTPGNTLWYQISAITASGTGPASIPGSGHTDS